MNNDDYKILLDKVVGEIDKNSKDIKNLQSKINLLKFSSFGVKMLWKLTLSILPFFLCSMILPNILLIPGLVAFLTIGISLSIGNAIVEIFYKRRGIVNKIRGFSNSKTESDKICEIVKYEIEKEELIKRNEVLKKVSDYYRGKIEMIGLVSNDYELIEKDTDVRDIDEVNSSVVNLEKSLRRKYNKLDEIAEEKVVHDTFFCYSDGNFSSWMNSLFFGSIFSLVCFFSCFGLTSSGIPFPIELIICGYGVGFVTGQIYSVKKRKNYSRAFEKVKDTILHTVDENKQDNSLELERAGDIWEVIIKLDEEKRKLDKLQLDSIGIERDSDNLGKNYSYKGELTKEYCSGQKKSKSKELKKKD